MSESVLDQLAPFVSTRVMRAGETIFCQGEPSPYCFGVLSGEVVIQRVSINTRFPPKILGMIGAGGLFGESAIFGESARAAMASSSKDGKLLAIRGPQLIEWMKANSQASLSLLMALWKTSMSRLNRTNQELSVIYGIGRLLGSDKPFETQLSTALDFLKGSLEGLDHVVFYRQNPFWQEFSPSMSFPEVPNLESLPLQDPLIQKVSMAGAVQVFDPKEIRASLEAAQLPWNNMAAVAIVPLFDWDKSPNPLQGLLFLASERETTAFSAEKQLLLASLSHPLAEALSRHARQEDSSAQTRLQQSKHHK